jgi:heme exporter protein A
MFSLESISVTSLGRKLFDNLSITLLSSCVLYITGKNGSGKTSLLNSIAELSSNYCGKITLLDKPLKEFYKPFCLYVGHKNSFELEMKAIDQLEFWAESYNSIEMLPAAIEFWGLEEILEKKISSLSAGNAKKLSLARLTCCHAELWLLDEVETNLDENNLKLLHYAITSKIQSGGVVIITSHLKDRVKGSIEINLEDYSV